MKLAAEILHALSATVSVLVGDLARAPKAVTLARLYECRALIEWAIQTLEADQ